LTARRGSAAAGRRELAARQRGGTRADRLQLARFAILTFRSAPRSRSPAGRQEDPMRTLITNGTIVTAEGATAADVLIDGETIAQIGTDLGASGVTADETIDAKGRWVIPGAIDVHTHMELPFGGTFAKDTFETGTRAAAFGGTTTIVDFAVQSKGKSLREGLDAWMAKAEGNAVADYGFHMIMSDVNDDTLKEMDALVSEGIPDFKLFTAYPGVFYSDDGAIFRAMQQTAKNGGLIMMHAENGMAIDVVAAQLAESGKTDPYYHGVARYPIFEGEATNRVIRLAEAAGVPIYIVHLSARDALNAVRDARDRGVKAFAETCPQYLFLSRDDLGNGFEGAKFVCSPPLRTADHQDELWTGLIKDDLQLVSTDHCPFDFEGQKELGRGDFRKVPNGLPGVEDRVDLLHDGGVAGGRITKERWVEIISTAPAKLFGMYPSKGAVAIGSDADIVIYDPNARHTISAKTHHMDVDYSCYEGLEVQCRSDIVLSRGSVIVRDGQFTGKKGAGRFVKRAAADHARLS
jgi:dihydropyrimidinase